MHLCYYEDAACYMFLSISSGCRGLRTDVKNTDEVSTDLSTFDWFKIGVLLFVSDSLNLTTDFFHFIGEQ